MVHGPMEIVIKNFVRTLAAIGSMDEGCEALNDESVGIDGELQPWRGAVEFGVEPDAGHTAAHEILFPPGRIGVGRELGREVEENLQSLRRSAHKVHERCYFVQRHEANVRIGVAVVQVR